MLHGMFDKVIDRFVLHGFPKKAYTDFDFDLSFTDIPYHEINSSLYVFTEREFKTFVSFLVYTLK